MSERGELSAMPAPEVAEETLARRRSLSRRRIHPVVELTVCRIKEFVREPEALFWVFAFPLLLAIALGLAFREKSPDRIPVGVVAGPAASRTAAALARSPALQPRILPPAEAARDLRTGKLSLLVEPGAGPGSGAAPAPPGHPAGALRFRFDPTRPDSRIAHLEAAEVLERAAGRRDLLAIADRKVTEPGARYIDFLIPGLLGLNLMGTGIWSLAFSITTARNRRILKRLAATPMRRGHFLLAQMLARLTFLPFEMIPLIGFGWLVFGVAVHGSTLLLFATCLLGALCFCGLGLLIASRVSTIEGASGLANLVMLPMWLLSGTFFSADRFPAWVQPAIHALPLTAVNDSLRAIMNEGAGLAALYPQLILIAAWGLVSFAAALKIFRWR